MVTGIKIASIELYLYKTSSMTGKEVVPAQ